MRVIRLPEVTQKTGISKSTVWRLVRAGRFPAPLKLGSRMTAWVEEEVDEWLLARATTRPVARERR